MRLRHPLTAASILGIVLTLTAWQSRAQQTPDAVLKAEAERVAAVAKVRPSVVAVFARGGKGGGSGVIISKDGYALTNFHVVQPCGPTMQCGLDNGILYDAVLVGLDKVGDVALIKLLPKKEGDEFPVAAMGDSDLVREGDWSLAMGNPFLLATDFTPTVTFGLVSGVHRYQYPAGTLLEYTDCIQIDTSINPGNSGGPLFNMKGELIGINGRGSFDKRGRINSGVGYAISINQIKNFMGQMKAGLDTDHATLGAAVTTQTERGGLGRLSVTQILEESDVARRGLDFDDELLTFDDRPLGSANVFKNVVGIFPRGWRLPLEYRRGNQKKEILVRLMGVQRRVLSGDDEKPMPQPKQQPLMPGGPPAAQGPAAKFYEPKKGFANHYFNKLERDRLLASFAKHGDFGKVGGDWVLEGGIRLKQLKTESKLSVEVREVKEGAGSKSQVKLRVEPITYSLEPLINEDPAQRKAPLGSGGLMAAMYEYHRLLTLGAKGFTEGCEHGGQEPWYPPNADGTRPARWKDARVMAEVLLTKHGAFDVKWYFAVGDQKLLGFELRNGENEDPCEVYFGDYRAVNGRQLPHLMHVIHGDSHYGTVAFTSFNLNAAN